MVYSLEWTNIYIQKANNKFKKLKDVDVWYENNSWNFLVINDQENWVELLDKNLVVQTDWTSWWTWSAWDWKQYVEMEIWWVKYKILHDWIIT